MGTMNQLVYMCMHILPGANPTIVAPFFRHILITSLVLILTPHLHTGSWFVPACQAHHVPSHRCIASCWITASMSHSHSAASSNRGCYCTHAAGIDEGCTCTPPVCVCVLVLMFVFLAVLMFLFVMVFVMVLVFVM